MDWVNLDWIGFDWFEYFYPALQVFLSGNNPYINAEIGNPPWTFFILSPLGFLPPIWSLVAINLISITGLVTFFFKNKKKWLAFPLVLSYPFLVLLSNSNLEGLLLWGLTIGGPVGLILLTAKPQAALLVGIIWAIKTWKKGGLKSLAILVGPLIILTVLSIIIYPEWPRNLLIFSNRNDGDLANGFPWLVPLGIGLFVGAVRNEREDWAAVATLLVAPYVRIQSWTIALCLLSLSYPIEGAIMAMSTWLVYLKFALVR
ncbi:MAG: hypothetical protein AB9891_14125 [Anaerolineaceae bacterium]